MSKLDEAYEDLKKFKTIKLKYKEFKECVDEGEKADISLIADFGVEVALILEDFDEEKMYELFPKFV